MIRLLMLGDSLVEWGDWERFLPGVAVINRGIAGEMTDELAVRLGEEIEDCPDPDAVLIESGTNNLLFGDLFFPFILQSMVPRLRLAYPQTADHHLLADAHADRPCDRDGADQPATGRGGGDHRQLPFPRHGRPLLTNAACPSPTPASSTTRCISAPAAIRSGQGRSTAACATCFPTGIQVDRFGSGSYTICCRHCAGGPARRDRLVYPTRIAPDTVRPLSRTQSLFPGAYRHVFLA